MTKSSLSGVVLTGEGGTPSVRYLLRQLARAGAERLILCNGHGGNQVLEAAGEEFLGLPVLCYSHDAALGSAGVLRQAWKRYGGERWLIANGDSSIATDLLPFAQFHERLGLDGSMLITRVEDCAGNGTVVYDDGGRVTSFQEQRGEHVPGWINTRVYLLNGGLLRSIEDRTPLSLEVDVLPKRIEAGLGVWPVSAPFIDGGTPQTGGAAQALFREGGPSRRYVVLDRDGTIIVDKNYLCDPEEVALLPGVPQAFARFRELGVGVIVVTNQSGIGRGYFSRQEVDAVHARMRSLLGEDASVIEAIYICPHVPADDCQCRKPRTGLLERASAELAFRAADCIVIGDKACDIDLGRNMDAATVLVQTGYGAKELAAGRVQPDFVATDLGTAAEVVASLLLRSE